MTRKVKSKEPLVLSHISDNGSLCQAKNDEGEFTCNEPWQVELSHNLTRPRRFCAKCGARVLAITNPSSSSKNSPIIRHKEQR